MFLVKHKDFVDLCSSRTLVTTHTFDNVTVLRRLELFIVLQINLNSKFLNDFKKIILNISSLWIFKDITEVRDINYWRHDLLVAVNYAVESNRDILLSLLAIGFAVITGNRVPVSVFLRAFSANLLPPLTVTGNDFVRRFHEWNHLSPPPPCNNSSFL